MRAGAAVMSLTLVACAIAPRGAASLEGCWLEQRGAETLTMRWTWGAETGWRGDLWRSAPGVNPQVRTYAIIETITVGAPGTGADLCEGADGPAPECLPVVFGVSHRDGHAEMHVSDNRLRVVWNDDEPPYTLFDGVRDDCNRQLRP